MKKTFVAACFIIAITALVQHGFAQNINVLPVTLNSADYSNQVFDAYGNMYFVNSTSSVSKKDAITGTVSVYAGGSFGYSGDGGAATAAQMRNPNYLAIDNVGNLYISDWGNFCIRKVNSSGVISTYAGVAPGSSSSYSGDGGPATAAVIGSLGCIAIDPVGNVYLSAWYDSHVRKIDNSTSHIISLIAGSYSAYGYNGDGVAATSALLRAVTGMCVDAAGNYLYVADGGNDRIRQIGISSTVGNNINTVAGTGVSGYYGDGGLATAAQLSYPSDVKIDCGNNLYISDKWNYRIRKVDGSSGVINTIGGTGTHGYSGDGGSALSADFNDLMFVSIDAYDNVYIIDDDTTNKVCRMICSSPPSVTITADPVNCNSNSANIYHATLSSAACADYVYDWNIGGYDNYTSSPTYTDYLAGTGNPVYCTVSYSTNAINDVCTANTPATLYSSASNTVYEEGLIHPTITDIDINTLCVPGSSGSTAPNPQFTATVAGTGSYSYLWTALHGNNVNFLTSGDYISLTPTILGLINPSLSKKISFLFSVTDASNGCVYSKNVNTMLITEGWDLATRDGHFDFYDEPANGMLLAGESTICLSPDIVNRYASPYSADFQAPRWVPSSSGSTTGSSNHLYTKVRNVGCIVSPSTGADIPTLYSYWTMGGAGGDEIWPGDWTGNYLPGYVYGTHFPSGLTIGSFTLPGINPGDNYIVHQTYIPPNPQDYLMTHFDDHMDLCFLSRIVDYHSGSYPGMTSTEQINVSPKLNITRNNNISTRNSSVMVAKSFGPRNYYVTFGNARQDASQAVSLQLANHFSLCPGTGYSALSSFVTIKAYLGDLYDVWQTGGSYGSNITQTGNEKSVTFDGSNTLQLDSIRIDSGAVYTIRLEISLNDGVDGNLMPEEMIHLRQLSFDTATIDTVLTNITVPLGDYTFDVRYNSNPTPRGVLAVTEISQGPGAYPGCEYAEFMVTACDTVPSAYVDVSGWVIDDNAGNFDLEGCASGFGITKGHYRLAYNSVWQNMPTGSKIVVYNAAVNCYNLSDTFLVDSVNNIYWVPVYDTMQPGAYVLERYGGEENLDMCHYCSDTGATVYTNAYNWGGTIDLNNSMDALQVRCPGCTISASGTPAFYHGIGYAPSDTSGFISITSGLHEIGEPYIANIGSSAHHKYVFIGASAGDFDDATKWTPFTPESAGSCPASLGKVDSVLNYAASTNTLGLPCCGSGGLLRHANTHGGNGIARTEIRVYPNPANTTLNFEFPKGDEVNIKLMDITGRIMDQQVVHNDTHTSIDVHSYSPGMYIYQVLSNGKIKSGKIVVQ